MDKFQTDERVLEAQLFMHEEPKNGPPTSLNVNALSYFAAYLLRKFTHQERCCIIEFELQTYLLELALYQLKYKTLKDITNGLLREMRMSTRFWIHCSDAWNQVQLRLKIHSILLPQCKEDQQPKKSGGKKSLADILIDSEALRKYIAQLDFNKLDYKNEFIRIPEVLTLIIEYDQANSVNKQLEAIDMYVDQNNTLQYMKQKHYEYIPTPTSEIKTQNVDLMSRINQPVVRETRQSRQSCSEQMSYRDIRMILKEQQRMDIDEKRTIFVPNQVYKYQKIDIIILPYIYKFIFKETQQFNRDHLRIQNLMLFLLLSDQESYKSNKQKKNITLSNNNEHKTSQKQFLKYIQQSNDQLMIDFDAYCTTQDICLSYYFSSMPSNYRKELILIRNTLMLAMKFAQQLMEVPFKYETDYQPGDEVLEDDESAKGTAANFDRWKQQDYSNDYVYFQVLTQLEYYYHIPKDQYDKLLQVYRNYYEVVMTSKRDHFKEFFGVIRSGQDGLLGTRTKLSEVDSAINMYINYINAPKTQEKRSYIYHSEDRDEWTVEQFKQFLSALHKYFEVVVNNKRIAKLMEGKVNSNHVRFVKGVYLRQLKKRAKERNMNRKELLQEDLEQFDISVFDNVMKKTK